MNQSFKRPRSSTPKAAKAVRSLGRATSDQRAPLLTRAHATHESGTGARRPARFSEALMALKTKKLYEKELADNSNIRQNIIAQINYLEGASIQNVVLETYKITAEATKGNMLYVCCGYTTPCTWPAREPPITARHTANCPPPPPRAPAPSAHRRWQRRPRGRSRSRRL